MKRSRIILLTLHVICTIMFALNAVFYLNSGDTVSGTFAVIAAIAWAACTALDIVALIKNSDKRGKR
jgi:hypothetical protein